MAASLLNLPRLFGKLVLGALAHLGRFSLLCAEILRGLGEWRIWLPRTISESASVGVGSLFIVALISAFAGLVTAFQSGYQWQTALPLYTLGTLIVSTVVLELGPVLVGLVLAGRIGARYAAELGTMRVTEQIDALESLGRSPVTHLILPRVLAGFVVIPALVMFANITGFLSGWIAAKSSIGITNADFIYGARYFFRPFDLWYSMIKAVFFAGAVTMIQIGRASCR